MIAASGEAPTDCPRRELANKMKRKSQAPGKEIDFKRIIFPLSLAQN